MFHGRLASKSLTISFITGLEIIDLTT